MNKQCLGCGIILQSANNQQPGYIKPEKLEDSIYCERCFRLKHYHEINLKELSISNEDLLKESEDLQIPIYYFLDIININEESLTWFKKIKQKKTLVLTKIDLIPYSISIENILNKIKNIYHIDSEILFITIKKETLIERLYNHITKNGNHRVLFLGMSNVGKSSIITEIGRIKGAKIETLISEMPNTTLAFLKNKIDQITIIDAPGFNYQNPISLDLLQKSVSKKHFKPITMQMKQNTLLCFEKIIYMSQNLEKNSITFYGNNTLNLEKKYRLDFEDYQIEEIEIKENSDFVLPGICFFSVKQKSTLKIIQKAKITYEIRPSLIGGSHDYN